MDFSPHQIPRCIIDQAVPGNGVLARKGAGYDGQTIMTAIFCTGVTGMQVRIVFDGNRIGVQNGQALAQQFDGGVAHAGRTFLNGLTLTFS